MVIYSNRNKTSGLILVRVKLVLRDVFNIERLWAETNGKVPKFLER